MAWASSVAVRISAAMPAMKKMQSGKIIFVGSESALRGARYGSLYCAAKFGLRGFGESLAVDLDGNAIAQAILH